MNFNFNTNKCFVSDSRTDSLFVSHSDYNGHALVVYCGPQDKHPALLKIKVPRESVLTELGALHPGWMAQGADRQVQGWG